MVNLCLKTLPSLEGTNGKKNNPETKITAPFNAGFYGKRVFS